jgi:hypothetical protein
MPTLEVSSGDVDCTHGATVADIDENQAFYLQSRGISRREVRHPHTPKKPRPTHSSPSRSPSSSSLPSFFSPPLSLSFLLCCPQARQVLMMGQAQEIYGSVPDPRLHKRLAQRLYDVCPQVRQDIQAVETTFKSLKSLSRGEAEPMPRLCSFRHASLRDW